MTDPNPRAGIAALDTYPGIAALSICEALLLALNDARVLPEREIMGILHDAAAAHENAKGATPQETEMHIAVADARVAEILVAEGDVVTQGLLFTA